jgi:hypothetical protein
METKNPFDNGYEAYKRGSLGYGRPTPPQSDPGSETSLAWMADVERWWMGWHTAANHAANGLVA